MEIRDNDPGPTGDDPRPAGDEGRIESSDARRPETDDYELTAKDAGWRTPTFLISRVNLVYFDPPRPKKRP